MAAIVVRATRLKLCENVSALATVLKAMMADAVRIERTGLILVVDVGGKTDCWEQK